MLPRLRQVDAGRRWNESWCLGRDCQVYWQGCQVREVREKRMHEREFGGTGPMRPYENLGRTDS